MSEQLKQSVLSFIKESQVMEIDDDGIEAYTDLQINNNTNEKKQVELFHELSSVLDRLMVQENRDSSYENVKEELVQNDRLVSLTKDGIPSDEELLRFLKQVQIIRRMVIDSTTMTLPILRSVHQVEGLTSKEAGIAARLEKRDDLCDEIIQLEKEVKEKQDLLEKLDDETKLNFIKSKELTSKLLNRKQKNVDTKTKIELEKKLANIQNKNYNLTEEIQAFIVENGINWVTNPNLQDLILYCGEIYE